MTTTYYYSSPLTGAESVEELKRGLYTDCAATCDDYLEAGKKLGSRGKSEWEVVWCFFVYVLICLHRAMK